MLPKHLDISFNMIHTDFVEIKKKQTTLYHSAGNGMAERVTRDIKGYVIAYPEYPVVQKCALEGVVRHHSRSHTRAIGCSPHRTVYRTAPILHADQELGIAEQLISSEKPLAAEGRDQYRHHMKRWDYKAAEDGHMRVHIGAMQNARQPHVPYDGLYQVTNLNNHTGVLEAVSYTGPNGTEQRASIRNISRCHPRSDGYERQK